jgi:hypothetical protein
MAIFYDKVTFLINFYFIIHSLMGKTSLADNTKYQRVRVRIQCARRAVRGVPKERSVRKLSSSE